MMRTISAAPARLSPAPHAERFTRRFTPAFVIAATRFFMNTSWMSSLALVRKSTAPMLSAWTVVSVVA